MEKGRKREKGEGASRDGGGMTENEGFSVSADIHSSFSPSASCRFSAGYVAAHCTLR